MVILVMSRCHVRSFIFIIRSLNRRNEPNLWLTLQRTFYLQRKWVATAEELLDEALPKHTSGGMGITVMLAIMVAGLAGAGWFIANQQQSMLATQDRLDKANNRLEYLEERLSATDIAMSQEGQDTKEQINLWNLRFANYGRLPTSETKNGSKRTRLS